MKFLNIFIVILFSLAGILASMQDIKVGFFSTWEQVFGVFPIAVILGMLLLGMSLLNVPFKKWRCFSLSEFILNHNQPHIFIATIGTMFFFGGILGCVISLIQVMPISKQSGMLIAAGGGMVLPAVVVCIYQNLRTNNA